MEQDVEQGYSTVCSTCLSSDRDLFALSAMPQIYEIFRWIMYDFAGGQLETPEFTQLICWECLAMFKRCNKFKWQVHSAQEHLRVLVLSQATETMDHTYLSQSLSSLMIETKHDYDKIFFDYSSTPSDCIQYIAVGNPHNVKNEQYVSVSNVDDVKNEQYVTVSNAHDVKNEHYEQSVRDAISLDIDDNILEVPEIVLENSSNGVLSHIVVDTSAFIKDETSLSGVPHLTIEPLNIIPKTAKLKNMTPKVDKPENKSKLGYVMEYMTESEMLASREEAKSKVQYASSVYKCELCVIGFYTQQQVEEHFETAHRPKPGLESCKVCYLYIEESKLSNHTDQHYLRYTCKLCSRVEYSLKLMQLHIDSHMGKTIHPAVIQIEGKTKKSEKRKKKSTPVNNPPKPGDLRKLLSKTTIEGYKCLECDMFFKTSRARKNHVARFHREGLQCDHCKKRFVNRTTLATHLRLHEGPLPREECPVCHKMVRTIQLKYHIQRHQNKSRYECADCNKVFSHLATYHAHLKYSRAHATDQVFKFPCPMCNKGYPTKEAMQDHFNYQHLGKTSHKCPICDKPIASRANVEKHIARVHGEKKERPRNHVCQTCGKPFTDKKALNQHEVIHSGARPLACDICQQSFKQKASLYTHKKRVHKVFPTKKEVHYMNDGPSSS